MTALYRKVSRLPLLIASFFISTIPAAAQSPAQTTGYLPLYRVSAASQRFLLAAGVRLRRAGKERVTAAGAVRRGQGAASPIDVAWEIPQRIRIDEAARAFVFDRANPSLAVPREPQVADLFEAFVEDSLEGFFTDEPGRSVRFIGSGFRDKTPGGLDAVYEIIEVWAPSRFRNGSETTVKQYWFEARSKLLSRVIYRGSAAPGSGLVEVLWGDWRDVQGERVPFSVERKESGRTTLQLTFSSAAISAKAEDGRFSGR
jgi:hypothetical protein